MREWILERVGCRMIGKDCLGNTNERKIGK